MRTVLSVALCLVALTQAPLASEPGDTIQLTPQQRQRCLGILRAAFGSDEFWPSMHAAEALTLSGHGAELLDALAGRLDDERDDQQRCGLAREQVRAGDITKAAAMLDILAKDDPYGHTHAAESLYKVAEVGDGRLLRRAMQSGGDVKLRLMAAAALARGGNSEALAFIRAQLPGEDADGRKIAAWILARIGDSSDVPQLRRNFAHEGDPLIRAYVAHALACLGDEAGRKALAENLKSDDPAIRTYAAVFAGDARQTSAAPRLLELLDDETLDVRVRAAQSLLVLSQKPVDRDEVIVRDVYEATAANPRYSEGSIVALPSRDRQPALLYATTEFIGGGADHASARIVARRSGDGGRTWSEPRVLQENVGKRNVMSVTLRHLAYPLREDTPLGMFYLVKNSFDDLKVYLRISRDGGQTFGEPIVVTPGEGYHVMNNDRVTLLSSGRLVCPVSWTSDVQKDNHFVAVTFLSDDGGRTWREGKTRVDLPKRGAMEPEVFELDTGHLRMILRTQLGRIAYSDSTDGGETWTTDTNVWKLDAPEAPATVRRIPATGDLLLIWNNNYQAGAGHGGRRNPLTAAISSDNGSTWRHVKNLETDPGENYAYTSVAFVQGRAVLSYYVQDVETKRISSRFRSLPVGWFYGEDPSAGGR